MHRWRKVGWVNARKVTETGGHWAVYADAKELKRLQKLRSYRHNWSNKSKPAELTIPTADRR